MAKHRSRFFTKALIGMGAVTLLTVTMPTPARAETINLACKFEDFEKHVSIDTDRQSVVVTGADDKPYGPYAVSISAMFFRWSGRGNNEWDYSTTIDRVTGTIKQNGVHAGFDASYPKQYSDYNGQCRRATQKF